MTATNHALTGAIIGAAVHQPLLALPAAFLSHYVLDMIPHYSSNQDDFVFLGSKFFKTMLITDAALCVVLVLTLALTNRPHWPVIALCAFLATSPDLFWINKYRYILAGKARKWKPNLHSRFATKIQWFAKPIGAFVELAWGTAAVIILTALVK